MRCEVRKGLITDEEGGLHFDYPIEMAPTQIRPAMVQIQITIDLEERGILEFETIESIIYNLDDEQYEEIVIHLVGTSSTFAWSNYR